MVQWCNHFNLEPEQSGGWDAFASTRIGKTQQPTEFKAVNWLPTKDRFDQHTCASRMNFFKGTAPAYANKICQSINQR